MLTYPAPGTKMSILDDYATVAGRHPGMHFIIYVLPVNRHFLRADERTRTADLLITSVRSVVAGRCRGLQIPHRKRVFCSLYCSLLQGVACGLGSN